MENSFKLQIIQEKRTEQEASGSEGEGGEGGSGQALLAVWLCFGRVEIEEKNRTEQKRKEKKEKSQARKHTDTHTHTPCGMEERHAMAGHCGTQFAQLCQ